jgi:hypothetical protein
MRPWGRIHDVLYEECRGLEGREAQPNAAIIDSQSVKTGPNAQGSVGYDAGRKIKGRKRHIMTDTVGLLLKAMSIPPPTRTATARPGCSTR